ncbi:uncharacterized protein [Spinacia oleracea]|uniref:Uncharacterized protein isoform X2 n=1 Tax=Spinacia oleracea TaxID=3562 RepID=A0ABM3QW38_SPIOL|nr:uncharacterized protein LOC110792039 isoform X2 [Spinacia oleracea]
MVSSQGLNMLWQEWHVKAAVLLSLLLQWLLLLLATFRKRTALMLLHLAGQERLTAYSVDDNNLWRTSTFSILLQLVVHVGLFVPQGDLPFPTRVMLCLAVWRIFCRAFRLRMGTQEMMTVSNWLFSSDHDPELVLGRALNETGVDDDTQTVCNAHFLLKKYSLCLLADDDQHIARTRPVRDFFKAIEIPSNAIRIVEIELNFIYESFHTDGTIRKHLNNNWSLIYVFLRSIESLFCVSALIFFIISSSKSADISRADYNVTSLLLWGTVTLELLSYIMTVFSDWTIAALGANHGPISSLLFQFVPQRRRWWSDSASVWVRFARNFFRRWSETICKFNFMRYNIQTSSRSPTMEAYMRQLDELTGTQNLITSFRFVSGEWYTDELGNFIFRQLQNSEPDIITSLKRRWSNDDSYKTSVLVWHIATELLYIPSNRQRGYEHCRYSKTLSDYMAYLLFMKPHFAPKSWRNPLKQSEAEAARRIIQQIAVEHQTGSFEERLRRCCQKILNLDLSHEANDDYVQSLSDAISKANKLHDDYRYNREALWRMMSHEWVKILVYGASKYDKLEHVRGLCQGGELISIVWLLGFHLGLFLETNPSSSTS